MGGDAMKAFFDKLLGGSFFESYISEPFSSFGWRDALDILCLAALFFALYLFVRDRRAGKLLFGVGIVLAVFALSAVLDMYAIRYILGAFLGYGLILLAIIFQPELRSALERIGSAPFSSLKTIGGESRTMGLSPTAVNDIVEAVKNMSFSKTGALIAIERSTKLGEYIGTGTLLNAELSPELLAALFVNKAPLHDGAVVIRGGRVYAAGCYLPLSEKGDIFKGLGTRHRAAIGLSEQSDAIVIVVSEETGTISIACKGALYREFTSVSLRRKLFELLRREEKDA
jgi:diadenylate cyclase